MRAKYSEDVDALYITLKDTDIVESDEISDGVIIDYDDDGNIVGSEILWVSEKEDIIQHIMKAIGKDEAKLKSTVRIDRVGQIYLPAELRKKLDFKNGDYLNLEVNIEDKMIILRPESRPDLNESINSLKMLMAEIHKQTKDIPPEEIEEAIREVLSKKRHAKSNF